MKSNLKWKMLWSFMGVVAGFASHLHFLHRLDGDNYVNLVLGRQLLQAKSFIFADYSSWLLSILGGHYIPYQWLHQLTLALLHDGFGGWTSVRIFHMLAAMATYTTLFFFLQKRLQNALRATVLGLGLIIISWGNSVMMLQLRPQSIAILLLLLMMLLLEWKRPLPAAVAAMVAMNIHGGLWPVFLLAQLLYMVREQKIRYVWLPLTLFLTPAPLQQLQLPFVMMQYKDSFSWISEWKAIWSMTAYWTGGNISEIREVVALLLVYLTTLWLYILGWKRRNLRENFALLLLVLLCISGIRYGIFMVMMVIPYLAAPLGKLRLPKLPLMKKWLLPMLVMVLLMMPLLSIKFTNVEWNIDNPEKDSSKSMVAAVIDADFKKLLNYDCNNGGYLASYAISPMFLGTNLAYLPPYNDQHQNYFHQYQLMAAQLNAGDVSLVKRWERDYGVDGILLENWPQFNNSDFLNRLGGIIIYQDSEYLLLDLRK